MEEKKIFDKKILLIVVLVLFVCVIGVSFAYFMSRDGSSGDGANAGGVPANLIKVTYDAGDSALSVNDLYPGKTASKTFKVSVNPTSDYNTAVYQIYIDISSNTFVYCDDTNYNATTNDCTKNASELIYNLKDSSGNIIATGDLTAKSGKIVLLKETKTVDTDTTYNYTLDIIFNETNKSQEHNTNKSISGSVLVEFVD